MGVTGFRLFIRQMDLALDGLEDLGFMTIPKAYQKHGSPS